MKRWLVLLLVGLAVVLLLSPGIVGRLAEKNIDRNLSRIDVGDDDISITAEAFERGWFTSEGRHRILLEGGSLREILESYDETGVYSGQPTLIIDTRVDHGLVPLSSMGREGGSLSPALANAVSTVKLDRGDGEPVDLPGTIYGFVGLGGASSFRFIMEEGRDVSGNMSTWWSGADITYSLSADGLRRSIEGTVEPAGIDAYDVQTLLGETSFSLTQDRRAHRLGELAVDVELESLIVRSPGADDVGIGPLAATLETRVDAGRTSGNGRLDLSVDNAPDLGSAAITAVLDFDGLDADATATVIDSWKVLSGARRGVTGPELEAVYPALEREIQSLVARGGRFRLSDAKVTLAQGDFSLDLDVEIDETEDPARPFSWPSVLLNARVQLDGRISAALFDQLVEVNPDFRSAVAGGFLLRKGDAYEIAAELSDGKLLINGAPVSLPTAMPQ